MAFESEHRDVVTLIESAIAKHGGEPLFGTEEGGAWRWTTFGAWGAKVGRLRAALSSLGVARGDRVGLISRNREEAATVIAATMGLGAVVVPMYEAQVGDWEYILADAGAVVCFVATEAIHDKLAGRRAALPALRHLLVFDRRDRDTASFSSLVDPSMTTLPPPVGVEPGDVAVYIYTSGTTGRPKGVKLTHHGLAHEVWALEAALPRLPGDRSVSIFPWAHVGGHVELLSVIGHGGAIALPESVEKIAPAIAATAPTVVAGAPRIWNRLHDGIRKSIAEKPGAIRWIFEGALAARREARAGRSPSWSHRIALALAERIVFPKIRAKLGGQLRFVLSGAAALSPEVVEFFFGLGVPLYEVYGLTETCAVATANTADHLRVGSVGRAIPGFEITIDREAGAPSDGDDGSGEIVITSDSTLLEYHGLPDETAAVKAGPRTVRTGDLGRLDEDGFLYITGRLREVYKLENGRYVSPAPIEETLALSPYISHAIVYGLNRPHNVALVSIDVAATRLWAEKNGVAATTPDALAAEPRVKQLIEGEVERLGGGLRPFERVRGVVLVAEEFSPANDLLTPTLKVKRRNVMSRFGDRLLALYDARDEAAATARG